MNDSNNGFLVSVHGDEISQNIDRHHIKKKRVEPIPKTAVAQKEVG